LFNSLGAFSASALDPFSQDCLDAHNNYRAKHGVPPLMWSHDLAEGAQNWADQLASTDSLQHDQAAIQDHKIGKRKILRAEKFVTQYTFRFSQAKAIVRVLLANSGGRVGWFAAFGDRTFRMFLVYYSSVCDINVFV